MDKMTSDKTIASGQSEPDGTKDFWKEPGMPLRLVGPAAATALLAAAIIPAAPPGLNLFLSAAAIGITLLLAKPAFASRRTILLSGLAIFLAMTPVIRSAGWVIALNLLLAGVIACWAVAGAKTWTALAQGILAPVGRLPQVPLTVVRIAQTARQGVGRDAASSVLRGGLLAGILLFVFGMLFVSADAAFAHLAKQMLPSVELDQWTVIRIALFLVVLSGTVALALAGPRFGVPAINRLLDYVLTAVVPAVDGRRRLVVTLKPIEWAPPLGLLVLLFGSFVGVQLTVLFGGHDHVLSTAGLTYAEYARQGFAQLIAASALTLGLLAFAGLVFDRPAQRDSAVFQVLCGLLCLLTLVVLASALHRLTLYEAAFGFTRLRLSGHAAILWMAGVFLLVGALGAGRKLAHLPLTLVTFSALALLVFTLWNPDAQIARRNIDRFHSERKLDAAYLSRLSADAVPDLLSLPAETKGPIVVAIMDRMDPDEPWTSWSLSRTRARQSVGP